MIIPTTRRLAAIAVAAAIVWAVAPATATLAGQLPQKSISGYAGDIDKEDAQYGDTGQWSADDADSGLMPASGDSPSDTADGPERKSDAAATASGRPSGTARETTDDPKS